MNFFYQNSTPFILHNPHSLSPLVHSSIIDENSNYLIGVFIDPGIINCAIRICKNDLITNTITTILQIKLNFNDPTPDLHYFNAITILNKYLSYFKWSHYIVIEKQLPINYKLVRMSQHLISYFMITLKNKGFRPLIYEIDPKQKSHLLGGKFKMPKAKLKIWCKDKALEILLARNDISTYNFIINSKKQDDHGDTVCYDECWWLLIKTEKIKTSNNNLSKIIIL